MLSSRIRRPVLIGLSMIAFFVVSEGIFLLLARQLPPPDNFAAVEEKIRAATSPASYDALVFGDSSAFNGVYPPLFEGLTGMRTYNFGTNSFISSFANVALLRRYLSVHQPPAIAIVVLNARYLMTKPDSSLSENLLYEEDAIPLLKEVSLDTWGTRLIRRILPSYNNRDRITESIRKWWNNEPHRVLEMGYGKVEGTMSAPTQQDFDTLPKNNDSNRSIIWSANVHLLKKFCSVADKAGIPVHIRIGPIANSAYANSEVANYAVQIIQFLTDTLKDYPQCSVHDSIGFLQDSVMHDFTHVNHTGAIILTNAIVQDLKLQKGELPR